MAISKPTPHKLPSAIGRKDLFGTGVTSRFDTKSGAFLAFNRNGTIRTFFKPNDGRRYFERQAEKDH